MAENVIVALITSLSPVIVSIIAITSNNKVIGVKIDALEKKQDKHNGLIERMVAVESSSKSAHHRLDRIERNENNED